MGALLPYGPGRCCRSFCRSASRKLWKRPGSEHFVSAPGLERETVAGVGRPSCLRCLRLGADQWRMLTKRSAYATPATFIQSRFWGGKRSLTQSTWRSAGPTGGKRLSGPLSRALRQPRRPVAGRANGTGAVILADAYPKLTGYRMVSKLAVVRHPFIREPLRTTSWSRRSDFSIWHQDRRGAARAPRGLFAAPPEPASAVWTIQLYRLSGPSRSKVRSNSRIRRICSAVSRGIAIASFVRRPWRYVPLRSPFGAPGDAPPCGDPVWRIGSCRRRPTAVTKPSAAGSAGGSYAAVGSAEGAVRALWEMAADHPLDVSPQAGIPSAGSGANLARGHVRPKSV
jgi:hypothetical protein